MSYERWKRWWDGAILVALAALVAVAAAGCTVQDQLAAAKGAVNALRAEQLAERERDPVRAYFEERNLSEAVGDADEIADWCEEARDRWGDDALDDSPTYDQVCELLLTRLTRPAEPCPDACPERVRTRPEAAPPAAALPPAVAAAEGLHDPPSPGAVSGDVHAGHGVNITDLANREAARLWREAAAWAGRWTDADACRDALAEVHYALGAARIRAFTRMLGEIESGDWKEAAYELRRSKWARQVGGRAERIARTLEVDCAEKGDDP